MVRLRWQLAHLISHPAISFSSANRVFVQGHGHHVSALGPDVVEVQDDQVALAAVGAAGVAQALQDEDQVSAPEWAVYSLRAARIGSPRS